ncbi:MAG: ABC transporter ATP-binding protein [Crenarchaeota archaeon]|nr:ABC transporter ATP-binding protein [Thermoproteota archaeon]
MSEVILRLENVRKIFTIKREFLRKLNLVAVDNVTLEVRYGETLALVGESGCGKSTTGLLSIRLLKPDSGRIIFKGIDITDLGEGDLRKYRRHMGIVFQNPYSSLNPRMTVFDIVAEPLKIQKLKDRSEIRKRVLEALQSVGLPREILDRYPHELSGGQRQRVAIARALVTHPIYVVLDEPTASLDVSIQASILNLLKDLKKTYGLSYLYISHDLGTVRYIADRVSVMYAGRIVEIADKHSLFNRPLHPYTKALLNSVPIAEPGRRIKNKHILEGEPPLVTDDYVGCRFAERCPYADSRCFKETPPLEEVQKNHYVACWRYTT